MKDAYSDDSYLFPSPVRHVECAAMPFETADEVPFWERVENGRTLRLEKKESEE